MEMVRGLNGKYWDDDDDDKNKNKQQEQNNNNQVQQLDNMKQNFEEAIKEVQKNEQFQGKK